MSIDTEVIEKLQQAETARVIAGKIGQTAVPYAVVPEGYAIKDVSHLMSKAARFKQQFKSNSVLDFGEYCKKFALSDSQCFVSADEAHAEAIFDVGTPATPLHQAQTATISLDQTSAYKAMVRNAFDTFSQRELCDFLEDWSENVTVIGTDNAPMPLGAALTTISKITIEQASSRTTEVSDFSEATSDLEKIEAKADGVMPAGIVFTCKPYKDLVERNFSMKISILTADRKKPEFKLRLVGFEAISEDVIEEFKLLIIDTLRGTSFSTYIGTAS